MKNKRTNFTKYIPSKLFTTATAVLLCGFLIFGFLTGVQGNEVASASDAPYIYNDSVNSFTSAAFSESSPRITLDMRKVDMQDVLSALAIKMGVNIILLETEPLQVTFQAENVTARQAMEIVIHAKGLTYIQSGDTIIVGQPNALQKEFFDEMFLTRFDTEYIEAEKLKSMIDELGIGSRIKSITSDDHSNTIWVQGTPQALKKVQELIANVDIQKQTGYEKMTTFVYKFNNIVAKDAKERLKNFEFASDVETMAFNNEQFGHELMISAPKYMIAHVRSVLMMLDQPREDTKVPVLTKTGDNAHQELNATRHLLSELSDLPVSSLHISRNLGDRDSPKYVLWVEESPDKVQLIKDLISEIGG